METEKNSFCDLIKAKKLLFIILAIFWAFMIFIVYGDSFFKQETITKQLGNKYQPVTAGIVVKQAFNCEYDDLFGISVAYGTFERENTALMNLSVKELDSGKILYKEVVDCSKLEDNAEHVYEFETQQNSKGREYEVEIEGIDGDSENCVLVQSIASVQYSEAVNVVKLFACFILIIASFIVTAFIKKPDEKSFLAIALILGTLMILYNPFVQPLDESTHFFRSFSIANGEWLDSVNAEGKVGSYMPENYQEILDEELNIKNLIFNSEIWTQRFSKNDTFVENCHMASVFPINHSVAALGIFIARGMGLPAAGVIFLSRFFPLLFYVICGFFAIRNVDKYKSLFFLAALMPVGVWLAASCSQDPVVNGTALFFVSICLKYKFDDKGKQVTIVDRTLILISVAIISSVKYLIYTPLFLLFFLIPREKMSKKHRIIMIASAITIVVVFAVIQLKLLAMFPFAEWGDDKDVAGQIQYILLSPAKALRNIINSSIYNTWNCIRTLCSPRTSGADITGPLVVAFSVFIAPLLEQRKHSWKIRERKNAALLFVFIFIVVMLLVNVALYLGFTPVGIDGIEGVQARYYLPVIILFMILLSLLPVKNNWKQYEEAVPFISMIGITDVLMGCLYSSFL